MNNEFLKEFYNRVKTAGLSEESIINYMSETFGEQVKQANEQEQVQPIAMARLEGFYEAAKQAGVDEKTANELTVKYAEFLSEQA
jgi:hypothetical protein